jgi:hypothetical protein
MNSVEFMLILVTIGFIFAILVKPDDKAVKH